MKMKVLLPGLIVPGGGYMVLGAFRQGLAFLSIGVLVAALWTDLFTQFRFGLLLFWAVLSLAGILGAEQVERYELGEGLGIAWILNGALILVALGLGIGFMLHKSHLIEDGARGPVNLERARYLLLIGEMIAYGLGGLLIGAARRTGVYTALWSAFIAIGWSLTKGVNEVGVEKAWALIEDRWLQVLFLYTMATLATLTGAWIGGLLMGLWRKRKGQTTTRVQVIQPKTQALQIKTPPDAPR